MSSEQRLCLDVWHSCKTTKRLRVREEDSAAWGCWAQEEALLTYLQCQDRSEQHDDCIPTRERPTTSLSWERMDQKPHKGKTKLLMKKILQSVPYLNAWQILYLCLMLSNSLPFKTSLAYSETNCSNIHGGWNRASTMLPSIVFSPLCPAVITDVFQPVNIWDLWEMLHDAWCSF